MLNSRIRATYLGHISVFAIIAWKNDRSREIAGLCKRIRIFEMHCILVIMADKKTESGLFTCCWADNFQLVIMLSSCICQDDEVLISTVPKRCDYGDNGHITLPVLAEHALKFWRPANCGGIPMAPLWLDHYSQDPVFDDTVFL